MISVDDRVGSVELIPYLQAHPCSPPVSSCRLLSGDVVFDGHGPRGTTAIGIERKTVRDMLNSIRSGRYSGHQLPEMLSYYDEFFLFVEGLYREGVDGNLEVLVSESLKPGDNNKKYISGKWFQATAGPNSTSTFRYAELDRFLCTIESHTPVKIRKTASIYGTVSEIVSLYTHRQKPWEDHHAFQSIYVPQTIATIGKAGFVRRVAACHTGIGWEKSGAIALKFNTGLEMAEAGIGEWQTVPGIGKTLGERCFKQWRGEWTDPREL